MIKRIFCHVFLLLAIVAMEGCASAQNYAKRTVDGKSYYLYFVEPGNTVYAISKMFSVDIDDLLRANPRAAQGLEVGQEILVPIDAVDKREARKSNVAVQGGYLLHRVQRKETMFSISRKYGVELQTLLDLNPSHASHLSTGDTLRIPADRNAGVDTAYLAPAANDSFLVHQVQKGETLYALSKRYGIPQDSLSRANAGFPEGLKTGRYITVPKYKESYLAAMEARLERDIDPDLILPEGKPDAFNIALMLPFSLDRNDSLNRSLSKGKELYLLTEIALEYYRGAMMALDSLKKMGLRANVYVYDVGDDIIKARDVVRRPEMRDMHMVFGPMHKASLGVVSEASRQRHIYLVSPNTFNSEVFDDNPYLMWSGPSDATLMRYLANYVAIQHGDDNVLMVNSGLEKDWPERRDFKRYYNQAAGTFPNQFSDSLRSVSKNQTDGPAIFDFLKKGVKNVLVVPSTDLAFVSGFLTRLSLLDEDAYDIQVYGLDNWMKYDNIEAAYKNRFHLRLAVPRFVDYTSPRTIRFLREYRARYGNDPSHYDYGFLGYDLTLFFGEALLKDGLRFPAYFDVLELNGVSSDYRFGKSMIGKEYENKSVYIIEYKDYEIQRVN